MKIVASGSITSWQIDGEEVEPVADLTFLGSKITVDCDWGSKIKRHFLLERKAMKNLDSILKSRGITLLTNVWIVKSMVFFISHVWMWEVNHKEGWVLKMDAFKLWCWRRLLREPWPEQIKPVNPPGNQLWIFFGRIDPEAEASILWPHDAKRWLTGKDPDPGKDWRQEEKGITEDEMMRWHHGHNRHELKQTPGDSEGQGSLKCCSPWGRKELDKT